MEIVPRGFVAALEVQSTLLEKIREAQKDDKEIAEIKEKMSEGKAKSFREDEHGTLWFEDRIYVMTPKLGSWYYKKHMIHHTGST